jgi:sigma-54-dependent transcriptional regulator
MAQGGTVLLDEVGDLPLSMQAKFLRFLQEGEVQRLGSSDTLRVDTRVIAASNANLPRLVKEGRFRDDLYYRLAVFPIEIDPLRLRREDIAPLSDHFLDLFSQEARAPAKTFSPLAARALEQYSWPGNVRELRQVIERAFILAEEQRELQPGHFRWGTGGFSSERNLRTVP